jgi:phosphoglycolate phosphatase
MVTSGRPAAVLYDHDGTLIDSVDAVVAATNAVLGARRLPAASRAQVVEGMAKPTAPRMGWHAGIDDRREQLTMSAEFYLAFRRIGPRLARPYPGVAQVVGAVAAAGIVQGVVSNNEGRAVRAILAMHGLDRHFGPMFGEEDVPEPKPGGGGLRKAAEVLGVAPADCIYVGDSTVDHAAAAAAGMTCVLVAWGTHSAAELSATGRPVAADTATLALMLGLG